MKLAFKLIFNFQPLSDWLVNGKQESLLQLDKTDPGEFIILESEDKE